MTCESCGEKPKYTNKDFTKAVIEIDNPESLVLLRKVVIPASLGTEENVPASIGKYKNVVLQYESNGHVYLYSSDGIPTAITAEVSQEVLDKISTLEANDVVLQQEIDNIKNSPDVVDVVATYAELMDYDTSKLGDNDIIRVLSDEEHDGASTYYRWDKNDDTWLYIGEIGDYYTKTQVNNLIAEAPAFKPFPDSVVTNGTTQQFMNSILALDPETGMAYLGTVSLSDMPAGLLQEEVEVYVYSDYVVYCVMRSTDVAPYSWWCASYNYQGWRPIGGASNTMFYANVSDSGNSRSIYEDVSFTTAVSVQDIIDANNAGQVILRMTSTVNPTAYNDAYLQNAFIMPHNNDYEFVFQDRDVLYEYSASNTSDTTLSYYTSGIQPRLSAGTGISITGTTVSIDSTTVATKSDLPITFTTNEWNALWA